MHINLTGHHLDVTDALKQYVDAKMARLERHFDHVTKMQVVLGVEKRRHIAEASMHVAGGNGDLFANATHDDMYAAIDSLTDKLDRQILKHKEKVTNHHKKEKMALDANLVIE